MWRSVLLVECSQHTDAIVRILYQAFQWLVSSVCGEVVEEGLSVPRCRL